MNAKSQHEHWTMNGQLKLVFSYYIKQLKITYFHRLENILKSYNDWLIDWIIM